MNTAALWHIASICASRGETVTLKSLPAGVLAWAFLAGAIVATTVATGYYRARAERGDMISRKEQRGIRFRVKLPGLLWKFSDRAALRFHGGAP